jgi:hypothetical protein
MGLMEESPTAVEENIVLETMGALKDDVSLKNKSLVDDPSPENQKERIGVNYLLHGDRGFRITDLFAMLEAADLEFVSMVNWRQWNVANLFQDPQHLPEFWQHWLAHASPMEKLRIHELLQPVHRLMDFWCTHPGQPELSASKLSVEDWTEADWQRGTAHLHPQLQNQATYDQLIACIQNQQPFEMSKFIPGVAEAPVMLEPELASCLLPLWEKPQPISVLAERYRQTHPRDYLTLEPISMEQAFAQVRDLLLRLERFLYVLLERT